MNTPSSFSSSDRSPASPGVVASASSPGSGQSGSTYSSSGSGNMGGAGAGGPQARVAVDRAEQTAHGAVDRLATAARDWADKMDERTRHLSDLPMRAWDRSRSTVQAHPLQALVVSMLLGYAIGRLGGSRQRQRMDH